MIHVNIPNIPSDFRPGPTRPAIPERQPAPEGPAAAAAAPAAPSPRETAGAMAPAELGIHARAGLHFEKRSEKPGAPVREIPSVSDLVGIANADGRPPWEVLAELRKAKTHFEGLLAKGQQTKNSFLNRDGNKTNKLIPPILNSENARHPGLNAVSFSHDGKMVDFLRTLSSPGREGQEGHVRCHVGFNGDVHRIAIDAFKHREGGFTLVAVESGRDRIVHDALPELAKRHSDLLKGALLLPTPNQVHNEGCRVFSVHTLNAFHDYQPYIENLHRKIYDLGRGRPAPGLMGPEWHREGGNTLVLADSRDVFEVLPGKFFKHMQVMKPKPGHTGTMLDVAESRNPALKDEPVNKKGQTLRERFASQNPAKAPEEFSRADRTASLDRKRLVLIDRAIAHYEQKYGARGDAIPPGRSMWIGSGWY
jgi:hypothetical protein